jgi:hypothetical protein
VEIALAKFNMDKVHKYKLHFVCGVNELVSGPEYNTTLGYNPRKSFQNIITAISIFLQLVKTLNLSVLLQRSFLLSVATTALTSLGAYL